MGSVNGTVSATSWQMVWLAAYWKFRLAEEAEHEA